MEFHPTLSNPYPAAAGTYRFDVMSEGPWKLAESPSDYDWLALETSEADPSYHPATASYPYYFMLAANSGSYLPSRTATIDVSSNDAGFPSPTSFEIEQSGTPPYITIIDPPAVNGIHKVDFGTSMSLRTVTIATNAPWVSTTGIDHDNVIANMSIDPDPVSANYTPGQLSLFSLTFTPTTFEPPATTGRMTTIMNFVTTLTGIPGVTNDAKSLTLKRYEKTYEFSEDYKTLTLYPNFDRRTDLDGLNIDNIPELADHASDVTTLVMQGEAYDAQDKPDGITDDQILGIKEMMNTTSPVLPSLSDLSFPNFNGGIPEEAFSINENLWLEYANFPLATSIGDGAFGVCSSLVSIASPNVTSVGYLAFATCMSLTKVSFPNATDIGDGAFTTCTNLTDVDLPNAHTFGGWMFDGCLSTLILRIDSPTHAVSFTYDTFACVGGYGPNGTGTTNMTLYLGANVTDERGNGRPDNLPRNDVEWGGYYRKGTWYSFTWGRIEKYEAQTPAP
jgi:hypothetical protein